MNNEKYSCVTGDLIFYIKHFEYANETDIKRTPHYATRLY